MGSVASIVNGFRNSYNDTKSYRDLEEMAIIRGVRIGHATLQRWVIRFAKLIDRQIRKFKKPVGSSWRMDFSKPLAIDATEPI